MAVLNFLAPDLDKFACLKLARYAARLGTGACIALNTANEIAVEGFFWQKKICLTDIAVIVKACLDDKTIAQDYSQDFGDEVLGLERILTMDKKGS